MQAYIWSSNKNWKKRRSSHPLQKYPLAVSNFYHAQKKKSQKLQHIKFSGYEPYFLINIVASKPCATLITKYLHIAIIRLYSFIYQPNAKKKAHQYMIREELRELIYGIYVAWSCAMFIWTKTIRIFLFIFNILKFSHFTHPNYFLFFSRLFYFTHPNLFNKLHFRKGRKEFFISGMTYYLGCVMRFH